MSLFSFDSFSLFFFLSSLASFFYSPSKKGIVSSDICLAILFSPFSLHFFSISYNAFLHIRIINYGSATFKLNIIFLKTSVTTGGKFLFLKITKLSSSLSLSPNLLSLNFYLLCLLIPIWFGISPPKILANGAINGGAPKGLNLPGYIGAIGPMNYFMF